MTTSGPARQRAPRVSAEQRRGEILVAAVDVFGGRGFHKASLGEIAERVGITHQGILHHFGSKEQLFVEALAHRERLDVAGFENHEPPRGPDLLRHLVHTAVVNTGRVGLVQAYVVLSAESVTEGHPAQESFRERFAVLRGLIVAALEASLPAEEHPASDEIESAACAIIAVMDGLQVQWLLAPEEIQMPATVALVIDAILERWGSAERTAVAAG
ncbi:TetR/AcrR family transcriptional regulator [Nocardioides hankookensis]|uniref:TetR/AcrR family transcriptional regulator n=1 Tax=Nocardioides hankookensis TaxID=443157 RepID=A0ABW1LHV2_9ACTN